MYEVQGSLTCPPTPPHPTIAIFKNVRFTGTVFGPQAHRSIEAFIYTAKLLRTEALAPVAQTRFPTSTPGATLCEIKGFRAIPNFQTSPWHSNSTAICKHCLANHTTTASTTAAINSMDPAITVRSAHRNFTLQQRTHPRTFPRRAAPVAQTRVPPSTPGTTLSEKTKGFVRFRTSKYHLYAAIPTEVKRLYKSISWNAL